MIVISALGAWGAFLLTAGDPRGGLDWTQRIVAAACRAATVLLPLYYLAMLAACATVRSTVPAFVFGQVAEPWIVVVALVMIAWQTELLVGRTRRPALSKGVHACSVSLVAGLILPLIARVLDLVLQPEPPYGVHPVVLVFRGSAHLAVIVGALALLVIIVQLRTYISSSLTTRVVDR